MSSIGITQAIHFVERDGYALLFFWVLAEQGALPLPSVPLLVAVGALVHMGRLNTAVAIACCVAGASLRTACGFISAVAEASASWPRLGSSGSSSTVPQSARGGPHQRSFQRPCGA